MTQPDQSNSDSQEGQFQSSQFNPFALIRLALRRVPILRYGLAVASLAAVASIASGYFSSPRAALISTASIFIGMALLLFLERASSSKLQTVSVIGVALLWCILIFFVAFLIFTVTAFAFKWPDAWVSFLQIQGPAGQQPQGGLAQLSEESAPKARAVARWLCGNAKAPFSIDKLFSSFPLETLGPVSKEVREGTDSDTSSLIIYTASGVDFNLEYRYQIDKSDAANYGMTVYLEENQNSVHSLLLNYESRLAWLALFGEAEDMWFGKRVGFGQKDKALNSYPFEFFINETAAQVGMNWFLDADIRHGEIGCAKLETNL